MDEYGNQAFGLKSWFGGLSRCRMAQGHESSGIMGEIHPLNHPGPRNRLVFFFSSVSIFHSIFYSI